MAEAPSVASRCPPSNPLSCAAHGLLRRAVTAAGWQGCLDARGGRRGEQPPPRPVAGAPSDGVLPGLPGPVTEASGETAGVGGPGGLGLFQAADPDEPSRSLPESYGLIWAM